MGNPEEKFELSNDADAGGTRASQRKLMAAKRAKERDVELPAVKDPKRRAACEKDPFLFLKTYFPASFDGPWTESRREICSAILKAAKEGGDQAIAAPRGEGKTTLAEKVAIYCLCTGVIKFLLLVATTGPDAERILKNIKYELETNDLLAEDFPEICAPIRALDGAPQRANMQTIAGQRTRMTWAGDYVVLPSVEGSKASGAVLMARGLDGSIRGIRVRNRRPDLVVIDDPETRESVASLKQTHDRELTIEQDIGGLGGPGKKIARVMLTTIQRHGSLSYRYTEGKGDKAAWRGKRFKLLASLPDREDLWEKYVAQWRDNIAAGDETARGANAFYLKNKKAMDEGAVCTNPARYIKTLGDDGAQLENSALQHCYNLIARVGRAAFETEYQNDPKEEDGIASEQLTARQVEKRINGYPRGIVPPDTKTLALMVDVGKRAIHYGAVAFQSNACGYVIDYGVEDVFAAGEQDLDILAAILRALELWWAAREANPYTTGSGEIVVPHLVMIDSGYFADAVYAFCAKMGMRFLPSKGDGKGKGKSAFVRREKKGDVKAAAEHWWIAITTRKRRKQRLLHLDGDHYKERVHDCFRTPIDRPGALSVFGENEQAHQQFAMHITAEELQERFLPGKGLERVWKAVRHNNHWLDCLVGCYCIADLMGVRLLTASEAPAKGTKIPPPATTSTAKQTSPKPAAGRRSNRSKPKGSPGGW